MKPPPPPPPPIIINDILVTPAGTVHDPLVLVTNSPATTDGEIIVGLSAKIVVVSLEFGNSLTVQIKLDCG
jgi:hypothetical protein